MALNPNALSKVANLSPLAGGTSTGQIFHYNAGADAVATVTTAGYFNDVRQFLKAGDRIDIVAATNTAFRSLYVATVPASGNVTVTALATA